jgi:hypothetical protein
MYQNALEDAIDLLEAEARRRGVEGWDEPVYWKGKKVGVIRKFSDTMLALVLDPLVPTTYLRVARHVELTGAWMRKALPPAMKRSWLVLAPDPHRR